MSSIITAIAAFIIAAISTLGYWGIVVLMALESACLPVPSEIVMPFSGYLASVGRFSLLLAVTAGASGCCLGSAAAYAVGATGGRRLVEKWGPYVFLHKAELDRFERYFARYGAITVFFARLLPMVPAFVSVPAGLAKMPFWKFLAYTFAGTWLWCGFLAVIGFELGKAWNTNPLLKKIQGPIDAFVAVAILIGACWIAWRWWRHRTRTPAP